MSKWSSPIPDIIVSRLSGLKLMSKVGSSLVKRAMPLEKLSKSFWLIGRMDMEITGSGTNMDSCKITASSYRIGTGNKIQVGGGRKYRYQINCFFKNNSITLQDVGSSKISFFIICELPGVLGKDCGVVSSLSSPQFSIQSHRLIRLAAMQG